MYLVPDAHPPPWPSRGLFGPRNASRAFLFDERANEAVKPRKQLLRLLNDMDSFPHVPHALSERAAELGLKHIARQCDIVAAFRSRPDKATAEALLKTLLESQVLREEHRDRLRRELRLAWYHAPQNVPAGFLSGSGTIHLQRS
jgi:hypothetical protein